jgi:hypothetical protein
LAAGFSRLHQLRDGDIWVFEVMDNPDAEGNVKFVLVWNLVNTSPLDPYCWKLR